MTSLPSESLTGPVRVLVRTRPVHLQAIHPSVEQANTALINRLCASDRQSITLGL
ncbi:hypothetical protein K469DRAFT_711010 [Zopfia rhizophila CBS 207.26]|uniref:Uncharacterized protein n=1 Tax=Zopfia rhizophila CBS 207.26 TaxID=1314779 RepID=A0A6A6DXH2_9PEZI|nr:hypothetical protein K469DRAFT_711010 [Zopfia rhizophila CBS 207.26]